jgi:D-sorbitol dehydrogenase (acceptor)
MGKLAGKIALVTGAVGGIGAAVAAGFAREGALVCVADLSPAKVRAAAAELGSGAFGVAVDVSDLKSIQSMVDEVTQYAGHIDILVNSAGVFRAQPWFEITADEFDRTFAVNLKGLLFVSQTVAQHMIERGTGSIINLSSGAGRRGDPTSVVYAASKAAVISVTQSAALSFAANGVRVNAIAPGAILTPMWERVDAEYCELKGNPKGTMTATFVAAVPLGRMGQPSDCVGAATFLACDESAYITGQTLNVDGGLFLN